MEAQNPQVNRMAHSKESETKSFSESHLSAHVQGPPNGDDNDDDVIECTVRQPPHGVAHLSQEIDTAEVTIGSQNEKSKSHKDCTVPNKSSVMEDENELVNSDEKKNCEVSHKGHGGSARTNSKKNGNSNETSMKPEAYNMTGVEEVGKEIATYSIENEVHSLQEVEEDNRSATNKKPQDVAHKMSGKEVNAKDHMSQRKKHENNRKSLNKEGAECNREKDAVSIKKSKKLAKENTKGQLTKSVVDNKCNEPSNISGNMIVAEKCNVQDTPKDFSTVHQHCVVGRNDQGSQPLDVKRDHNKEQDSSKAKKSTKSRNESSKVCLAKSIVGNTVSEHDKIVGDPVIVEKVKVQDTLEKNSDTRHHNVPESEEKRSEVIHPLNMEGELVCADITTVKTCTELRKESIEESFTRSTVDSIYHDLDNIPNKHRAVEQSEMQNTSKNIPDAQHLNVDSSENDVKDNEDHQPSFVSNNSADSSNMYVIIKYEGNGPRMQQKESEDLSDTTFTLMDEAGSHTLSVTGFFDLLSISPEKVSPRVLNRSTNEPDLTSKSATVPLVHEEERSVSHTKAGGSVSLQGSLHLKQSSKKEHHSGHSGSKTSRERRREGQVKHTNSSYKHRIGEKSLKTSESRASNKTKRLFQSPDKIMSKYRHGVKGSPRSSTFQRDRSVTPSRVPPRRLSTDGTKPRRLPLKSPRPPSKLSSSVTVESVIKRGTPVSRLKDMRHKSSHKRESVSQNPSKKCSSSGTQVEGETVKHKKEKCDLGHVRNSSDSMAVRDRRDSLQGAACSLLKKVREDASVTDSGDDLMTYALIGSVREEDSNSSTQQQSNEAASRENWSDSRSSHAVATSSNEDLKILPPKKRKPSTEDGLAQVEKKIHTEFSQRLLKGIDVDNFLNYVHDGEKRHKD
ncbi:ankyrin repeat domain-containing protein 12-like [Schistocerca cancellata]|uniref:ankyrin repeat domain-containing protein 12-like n=1 Tax=Schistocerca cancellata TaxID=274614 RepID=UPI002118761E|nr:ankyrin repeat domain-containing protein 12-like [Schistocerca cancellata]